MNGMSLGFSRRGMVWIGAALLTLAASVWLSRAPTTNTTPQQPSHQTDDVTSAKSQLSEQQIKKLVDDEHARAVQAREKARASAQQYALDMQKRHAERARQEAIARAQAQAYITQQREGKLRSEANRKAEASPSHP